MEDFSTRDEGTASGPFGQPVRRLEDPSLLRGQARFADDIPLPGLLHAAFVRSPLAHARIGSVDIEPARDAPGVRAVLTMADLAAVLTDEVLAVGMPSNAYLQTRDRPILAHRETCHVGEAVAVVIADSRYLAEDAASLVIVDYQELPVSADIEAAARPGAPLAHSDAEHNILAAFSMGYGDTDAAFGGAAYVVEDRMRLHKGLGMAIEGRGIVARYDTAGDELTVWLGTQMPHMAQRMLVRLLGRSETNTRVVTPDIGGGFGPKLGLLS